MLQRLFDLTNRKAIVTGGATGVGRACATALAMSGASVAIIGRTRETADRACDSLSQWGVEAFFIQCDVADPDQVDEMTSEVVRRFGRIDIAVNNAGGSGSSHAMVLERQEWDRTIDVNLAAVFWCARAQARQMVKQTPMGGKIINIASMYATVAGGTCAYNASKAGVVHLTRSLASEWGSSNINVNCISPGWMLTPGNPIEPALREQMRKMTPMGSLMRYEDVYGAVIYLAASASDFVTGHDLIIDGGHTTNTWLTPLERNTPARTKPDDEEAGLKMDVGSSQSGAPFLDKAW